VTDDQLDAIRFEPIPDGDGPPLVRAHGAESSPVLTDFLGVQDWTHLRYWLRCASRGNGGAFDELGFEYDTDEHWPGDEPFTGVRVFVPWGDEELVGRAAFECLLARFGAAVAEAAQARRDPATAEAWWPAFSDALRDVQRRATGTA
jgi:hypothetical protein